MQEREDWRSQRRAEVTVGPAMILVDAGMLQMMTLDRQYGGLLGQMPADVRADRLRLLNSIMQVGREIGLPEAEIEDLRRFGELPMLGVRPSTVREMRGPAR